MLDVVRVEKMTVQQKSSGLRARNLQKSIPILLFLNYWLANRKQHNFLLIKLFPQKRSNRLQLGNQSRSHSQTHYTHTLHSDNNNGGTWLIFYRHRLVGACELQGFSDSTGARHPWLCPSVCLDLASRQIKAAWFVLYSAQLKVDFLAWRQVW